jgi:hypothetical protein
MEHVMNRAFLMCAPALTAVFGLALPVHGAVGTYLVEVDNSAANAEIPGFSEMYDTYDLLVELWPTEDWESTSAVDVTSGEFYDHPLGDLVPMPNLWPIFPAAEFDSFYATPDGFDQAPGFLGVPVQEIDLKIANWFDPPPNGGGGVHTIARYTVTEGAWLHVTGEHRTGGTMNLRYDIWVPAPGGAGTLGVICLAASRRSRGRGASN